MVSPKSSAVGGVKRAELSMGRPVSVEPKSIQHHMEGMDVKEFHSSPCQPRHGGTLL